METRHRKNKMQNANNLKISSVKAIDKKQNFMFNMYKYKIMLKNKETFSATSLFVPLE